MKLKKMLAVLMCVTMVAATGRGGGASSSAAGSSAPNESSSVESAGGEASSASAASETPAASETGDAASAAASAAGVDLKDAKVGISIYQFSDNFMTLYRTELVRYMVDELGFSEENITVQGGKNDQAEQTNQINNFITSGVDVMILNLVQSSSAAQVTDTCNAAGIPVVYINRQPDESESDRWTKDGIKATYIGADARQSGTFQGEEIAETANKGDINGDGKVSYIMIQGDPENIDAQYRTEFSVKALQDAGMEREELLLQRGDWDQAKGQQITQDALTQFGEQVEVVFCNNDSMALGALQAIQAAGRVIGEDIYLVGVDALTDAVQNIVDGKFTGTVFNDYFGQAQGAADLAVKFLNGEEVDAVNMVDYVKVTADNAAEILEKIK